MGGGVQFNPSKFFIQIIWPQINIFIPINLVSYPHSHTKLKQTAPEEPRISCLRAIVHSCPHLLSLQQNRPHPSASFTDASSWKPTCFLKSKCFSSCLSGTLYFAHLHPYTPLSPASFHSIRSGGTST